MLFKRVAWLYLFLVVRSAALFTSASSSSSGAFRAGAVAKQASSLLSTPAAELEQVVQQEPAVELPKLTRPLRVLFLSSDTGGGHRASAEALAKQFQLHYPGSTYDLVDVWTLDGVYPYKTLVQSYAHLSHHPRQWKFFYHLSNTTPNLLLSTLHGKLTCQGRIQKRISSYNPDVVVSVHPTMNSIPLIATRNISKSLGRHIPFFTVVTDFGSGHSMWFSRRVEKMYLASDRIRNIAKRRARVGDSKIVMSGLPIRHDFAEEADRLGDRVTDSGKQYQKQIRQKLSLPEDKQMVLVMGGGEGVGSLWDIVNELYAKFRRHGIDATICVVCGRNEKLRLDLEERDWNSLTNNDEPNTRRRRLYRMFHRRSHRSKQIQESLDKAIAEDHEGQGDVHVVGLGFVTNMAEYMVAADVLVTKAGPGTIAEAAAVGLPVMLTSYLPGQEAGNVEVVLEGGFGDYCKEPEGIAEEVSCWLQDPQLLRSMSLAAEEVGHPHAAEDIVKDIGDITQSWMELNEKAGM